MKTIKKLFVAFMLIAAVAMTACSPEDEPNNGGNNNGGNDPGGDTPSQTDGPIHLPSLITEDMDLQDLGYDVDYIIDNGCSIKENALVTVGPGVTIQVEGPDYWNDVFGIYVRENAALKMTGTASKPVRFVGHEGCSTNERTWLGISVASRRPENQWDYVEILNAGVEEGDHPAVWVSGVLALRNCLIDGSNNSGLGLMRWDEIDPELTEFKGNTIKNCDLAPISMYGYNAVNCLVTGNTYQNENNYVYFYSHAGITHHFDVDVRFRKLEIPYYFDYQQEWRGANTVTIDPGVEMLFETNGLEVYSDLVFKAVGTEGEPIVFRPRDPQGRWGGLIFANSSLGNIVSHCVFKDGGSSSNNSGYRATSLLYIGKNAKLTLTNNQFNTSRYYGVAIEDIKTFDNVVRSGNRFRDCELSNVHINYGGEYHGVMYSDANHNKDLDDFPN